jgi:predicted amidohydrolase YtcJ
MLDGVIEAHTAAMLAPYTDDPTQSGKLFWDPDKYKANIADLDARGLQIFTHAIGDKAVRLALDAYQNAAEVNHTKDARPRIEHIETISAARYRPLRQTRRHRQHAAAAFLSRRRHAQHLGAQHWTRACLARLGLAQHSAARAERSPSAATGPSSR